MSVHARLSTFDPPLPQLQLIPIPRYARGFDQGFAQQCEAALPTKAIDILLRV